MILVSFMKFSFLSILLGELNLSIFLLQLGSSFFLSVSLWDFSSSFLLFYNFNCFLSFSLFRFYFLFPSFQVCLVSAFIVFLASTSTWRQKQVCSQVFKIFFLSIFKSTCTSSLFLWNIFCKKKLFCSQLFTLIFDMNYSKGIFFEYLCHWCYKVWCYNILAGLRDFSLTLNPD